jgi:hypothetical protein
MTLTLVRINSNDLLESMLKERDQYTDLNKHDGGSQTLNLSFVQIFHFDYNQRR